jgi:hypothetical protein
MIVCVIIDDPNDPTLDRGIGFSLPRLVRRTDMAKNRERCDYYSECSPVQRVCGLDVNRDENKNQSIEVRARSTNDRRVKPSLLRSPQAGRQPTVSCSSSL